MIVKQRISIYVLVLPLDVFPDTCDTFVAPVSRRFEMSLSLRGSLTGGERFTHPVLL